MKITIKELENIIEEEINNSEFLIDRLLETNSILANTNKLLPSEWKKFKKRYLKQHRNTKVVSGSTKYGNEFEAIVDKSKPREAIVKYLPSSDEVLHDMRPGEFYDYIRY